MNNQNNQANQDTIDIINKLNVLETHIQNINALIKLGNEYHRFGFMLENWAKNCPEFTGFRIKTDQITTITCSCNKPEHTIITQVNDKLILQEYLDYLTQKYNKIPKPIMKNITSRIEINE